MPTARCTPACLRWGAVRCVSRFLRRCAGGNNKMATVAAAVEGPYDADAVVCTSAAVAPPCMRSAERWQGAGAGAATEPLSVGRR